MCGRWNLNVYMAEGGERFRCSPTFYEHDTINQRNMMFAFVLDVKISCFFEMEITIIFETMPRGLFQYLLHRKLFLCSPHLSI